MKIDIILPFVGLGEIKFGVDRNTLRDMINSQYNEFTRSEKKDKEIDCYNSLGIFLYFDNDNKLEYIEVFPPLNPSFEGCSFMGKDMRELFKIVNDANFKIDEMDYGYDFPELGFNLVISNEFVSCVSIYRMGYYDE